MKKIIYIFALISITFTSCDKNEVNITKNNILTFDSQQKTKKDVEFEKLTIGLSNVINEDQFLKTLVSTIESDENSNDEEVLLSTFKQKTITDNLEVIELGKYVTKRIKKNINNGSLSFLTN